MEIDPWCRRVLAKHWPGVPKYGDVREVSDTLSARAGVEEHHDSGRSRVRTTVPSESALLHPEEPWPHNEALTELDAEHPNGTLAFAPVVST